MKNLTKQKILFMVHVPPPIHGAALRNESLMKSGLLNKKYEIIPLPLKFPRNISDIGTFSFLKLIKTAIYLFNLILTIIINKPDLAYFTLSPNGYALYRDSIFVLILKIFNVKILYHLRGKGIKVESASSKLKKRLYKFLFKNTTVICLSNEVKNDIEDVYDKNPKIVNNGIAIEIDNLEPKIISKKIKLLFLSNLIREKGIIEFLEAIKILKNKKIDFYAEIVGAEMDVNYDELRRFLYENKLFEHVSLIGPKYNREKFDILIFPTYYKNEIFPGVILEAFQCGVPVISTFEGAIPDIIDDGINGFLVTQKDSKVLAEKIEILINNPELRKKMGENARLKFLNKYTLEIFEKNMNNVFNDVFQMRVEKNDKQ